MIAGMLGVGSGGGGGGGGRGVASGAASQRARNETQGPLSTRRGEGKMRFIHWVATT